MRATYLKHSRAHNWNPNPNQSDGEYPDGGNCAFLTTGNADPDRDEHVVCIDNGYQTQCTHPGHLINGWDVVIKQKGQRVACKHFIESNHLEWGVCQLCRQNPRGIDGINIKMINNPFALEWKSAAVIVMDMWDTHPSPTCASHLAQLAPKINDFVNAARAKGALIIHSPSKGVDFLEWLFARGAMDYDTHPARLRAIRARCPRWGFTNTTWNGTNYLSAAPHNRDVWFRMQQTSLNAWHPSYYFANASQSHDPGYSPQVVSYGFPEALVQSHQPFRQNSAIVIDPDHDAIVGDGIDGSGNGSAYEEVLGLTVDRPNVIFCGVATNQCVIRRTNGMRTLYKAGKSMWLVRDLTDACCVDSPDYTQSQGTQLVVNWIGNVFANRPWYDGARICTDTSVGVSSETPFKFNDCKETWAKNPAGLWRLQPESGFDVGDPPRV